MFCIKNYFGTIREASGSNDHPATPTFIQLYKLLSVYGILKPPKRGNCSIDFTESPELVISVTDIKKCFQKPESRSKEKITEMTEIINKILEQNDWEADDVFSFVEHDYSLLDALKCIIYYATGLPFYYYLHVNKPLLFSNLPLCEYKKRIYMI